MANTEIVMRVRFKSDLPIEKLKEIVESRAPEFAALPGLKQKYYLYDPETGHLGGLYIWESAESLQEYKKSELRASIAEAYQAVSEPDIEVFPVFKTLR